MKRFLAALVLAPAHFVSGGESNGHDLGWLEGCWVSADSTSHEVWVAESADRLTGFGMALADNRLGFYEVLTIIRGADGAWTYTAYPAGQPATSFVASEVGAQRAVFVNARHDYPQEIRYRRDGDALDATISLLGGAKPTSFTKVACASN